jgi:hypothetical protein
MATIQVHFIGSDESPLEITIARSIDIGDILKLQHDSELEYWKVDEISGNDVFVCLQ